MASTADRDPSFQTGFLQQQDGKRYLEGFANVSDDFPPVQLRSQPPS